MDSVVIAGSTGLIGQQLARQLKPDDSLQVTLLSRRSLTPPHPAQQVLEVDFNALELPAATSAKSAAICALGTTIKTAGSQAAFSAVDLDMVVHFAQAAKAAGYTRFAVVSSVGADTSTGNFYLQTKGKMEQALLKLDFPQLLIVRPSLLLGARAEFRLGEQVAQWLSPLLSVALIGRLRRYRPVQASAVARALISVRSMTEQGPVIVESDAIGRL